MCVCIYVYVCMCIYVYMCMCIYVYVCMCIYTHTYTQVKNPPANANAGDRGLIPGLLENPIDRRAWWACRRAECDLVTRRQQQCINLDSNLPTHCLSPLPLVSIVCFLSLCLHFCFGNKFTCTIFLDSTYEWCYMIFFSFFIQSSDLKRHLKACIYNYSFSHHCRSWESLKECVYGKVKGAKNSGRKYGKNKYVDILYIVYK